MYSVFEQSGKTTYGIKFFICDTPDDVLTLPIDCEAGSEAFVIETSQYYMLNNNKEWKEYSNNGNGGTSGIEGKDGATFIPSVSKDGVISWTNNKNLKNPTPINIKGEPGEAGKSAYEIALSNGFDGQESNWLKSLIGKTGAIGETGRNVELRKNETFLEWRYNPNREVNFDCGSGYTYLNVNSDEIITKVRMVGVPLKAKYYKIDTVTIRGADINNNHLVNVTISNKINQDCSYLGGFNPRKGILEMPANQTFDANMEIETATKELMKLLSSHPEIVKIAKIDIDIHLFDAEKNKIRSNLLRIPIGNEKNEWKMLIDLTAGLNKLNNSENSSNIKYIEGRSDENGYINELFISNLHNATVISVVYLHPNFNGIWMPCLPYQTINGDNKLITGNIKISTEGIGNTVTYQIFKNCPFKILYL